MLHQITEHEIFKKVENLKCYTYTQGKMNYELYFFCYVFDNEKELLDKYEEINDIIAYNFQSQLDKKIEKWNVYFFLFTKEIIAKQNKISVEQNKYATRKIIIDNFRSESLIEEQKDKIKEKILLLELGITEKDDILITVEPDIDNTTLILLEELRGKSKRNKKEIINNYIKGVNNEP